MTEISINQLIKVTDMYEEARRRYAELSKIKNEREQALAAAPEGKIHIVKAGKRIQFYLRKDKKDKSGIYIPKSEIGKIRKYVQKSYDEKVVKALSGELHSLEILLGMSCKSSDSCKSGDSCRSGKSGKSGTSGTSGTSGNSRNLIVNIRNIFSDNSVEIKRMVNPVDISDEDFKSVWQRIPYTGKAIS